MQFNPSDSSSNKQKINSNSFTYHINEVPIKAVQNAKYLGVGMLRLKTNMEGTYHDN